MSARPSSQTRRKKLTYAHKGNVIRASFALGDVVADEAKRYPGVALWTYSSTTARCSSCADRPSSTSLAENMFGGSSDPLAGITDPSASSEREV